MYLETNNPVWKIIELMDDFPNQYYDLGITTIMQVERITECILVL